MLNQYTEKFMVHRKMWEAEWARNNRCGLSSFQAMAMIRIHKSGPLQAKQLIEYLAVSSGGVTVIANELIKRGFIRRIQHGEDKRGILLEITDQGREFCKQVEDDWNNTLNKTFSVLTEIEVAILLQLFTKLVDQK
jgi:DNA-binding MarR family transcriptional regulator